MVFLSIYADNVYMFRDFCLDFTVQRRSSHFLSQNDALFDGSVISVRRKLLILGGNASGKTTFARLLCAIQNYLIGREMSKYLNLIEKIYDPNRPGIIKAEFALKNVAFSIECEFDTKGVIRESLRRVEIFPTYSTAKLREKLYSSKPVDSYDRRDSGTGTISTIVDSGLISYLLFKPENKSYLDKFRRETAFSYIFSDYASNQNSEKLQLTQETLNKIVPHIDNSVERIVALKSEDPAIISNSYMIVFKNGTKLTIPDGDLKNADRTRLSHGTYEILQFLNFIAGIKNTPNMTAFADEQLPHSHTELEAYFVMKALLISRTDQLFYTTHNAELLNLNIPPQMVLLFRRNDEGFNEAIYVNERLKKNDRSIKGYYDNDFFGIMPDYSILDEYFEEA